MSRIKDGEYVLATRWSDGDPMDPWAFGFLQRLDQSIDGKRRYYAVVDSEGRPIGAVYTRAQRITKEFGDWLLSHINTVETSRRSLWWWKANYNKIDDVAVGGRK